MAAHQDTELKLDVGQANEIKLAARRNGWSGTDLKRLCEGDMLGRLLPVVRGHAEVKPIDHVINCDIDPFVPEDWRVERHRNSGLMRWEPKKVKLHLSPNQQGGNVIVGNKLRVELANILLVLNANVLDYLLKNPHLIPEEWKGQVIFFWGTIYCGDDGLLYVRNLFWSGGRWCSSNRCLDSDWDVRSPAAVLAS